MDYPFLFPYDDVRYMLDSTLEHFDIEEVFIKQYFFNPYFYQLLNNLIMSTKITFEDWIDIFAETLEEFANRFSDDGKLSVADGISIFMVLLRAISRAAKDTK